MKLKSLFITAGLLISSGCPFGGFARQIPLGYAQNESNSAVIEQLGNSENYLSASLFANETNDIAAGFTCITENAAETVWSENFDNGSEGWTLTNAEKFGWEVKAITGKHAFTAIDPNDKQSLKIEGDYKYYNRGTATAVSPKIQIPRNATFSGYVGFSRNFNDDCTLTLFISEDGSAWSRIWASSDDNGERPWAWRKFNIDLAAYSGKIVQFKFEYGNNAAYDNAGYMGDFIIDGLKIDGAANVESISVMTGEPVKFADTSTGNITSWTWNFPGGTPETSNEQNPEVYYKKDGAYDVSLTVSDGKNNSTKTIEKFVTVTGVAPVAKIMPPATFRFSQTRLPMIAPLVPVQYEDASEGYPTSWLWSFTGTEPDNKILGESTEECPLVDYDFLHRQTVALTASNSHGSSDAVMDVSVEYGGFVNNLQPEDNLTTFNLGDGYGEFPGTNKLGITDYAEKFSKPSRPIVVYGAKVYFTNALATSVSDQIANIKVSLCKSENGMPGEELESMSWRVFELDLPSGTSLVGTDFEFSRPVTVRDEFFFVVSGIPEKNDSCRVSFAMANFRAKDNTAYFKRDNKWISAAEYFPAGKNHTSFAISPSVIHSVMKPLDELPVKVGSAAGETKVSLFSVMGYKTPVESNANWCKVTGKPNGMTVDELVIAYESLPNDVDEREAIITVTDGVTSVEIPVIQTKSSSISNIDAEEFAVYPALVNSQMTVTLPSNAKILEIYSAAGCCLYKANVQGGEILVDCSAFPRGLVIVKLLTGSDCKVAKVIKE